MFEDEFFQRKKVNISKLKSFGFKKTDNLFEYNTNILDEQFDVNVTVTETGNVSTQVYDRETGDEYTLYKTDTASGKFVGQVRVNMKLLLADIAQKCFEADVFKTEQAHSVIEYVRKAYGDEPEFLWTSFPDNAIWRRKDTRKWYGAILTVSRRKLGLDSNEIAEIIDLRLTPTKIKSLVDGKKYFPGWHMNKKTWYTIILDGSVDTDEICNRIDVSYQLTGGK